MSKLKEKISKIIKFILEFAFMVLILMIILRSCRFMPIEKHSSSDPYANYYSEDIERY